MVATSATPAKYLLLLLPSRYLWVDTQQVADQAGCDMGAVDVPRLPQLSDACQA
jgi:hypothetical protein